MQYVVLHTVRVGAKTIRNARLVVTDVPEKTSAAAVMNVLEEAGKAVDFADGGVTWGNHEVKSDKSLPADTAGVDDAPRVSWVKLQDSREIKRITLRLPSQDYARIRQAAQRSGKSIQKWCEHTLAAAATANEEEK